MTFFGSSKPKGNPFANVRRGRREDLGDVHFDSRYEANYARYLNHKGIQWERCGKVFYFEGVTRGAVNYKPDFYLAEDDEYIEIKGWEQPKDRTKWKRMAKYHPDVKLRVVPKKEYLALEREFGKLIPNWEFLPTPVKKPKGIK